MHFDDRLATVLRQPARGDVVARIQYRHLLDLLGTRPSDAQGVQIDAAYLRLAELSQTISAANRKEMLNEPGLRLRSPRLVAQLAEDEPRVTSAALTAADLTEEQWLDLIPALPVQARGFIRHRRNLGERIEALLFRLGINDRGLPPASPAHQAATDQDSSFETRERIGAIVKRIEEFRKTRQHSDAPPKPGDAPRLPLDDGDSDTRSALLEAFDYATDSEGRIVWADPAIAPMAVGLRLIARDSADPVQCSPTFIAASRHHLPIQGERLAITGAPAISGDWIIDSTPCFDQAGGRFVGYCGRLRRPSLRPATPPAEIADDTDRMRQILHELRTPVNAIQGFAEVIQQQLFGPTPNEYRALAAGVAGDSARILAAFEELDRLVKLESGTMELETGSCDLAQLIEHTASQLDAFLSQRNSGFHLQQGADRAPVKIAAAEAERLVWRLLATLAGAAVSGEVLKLKTCTRNGNFQIDARLPASLAQCDDETLFRASAAANPQALSAGMFGTGFALRLVAAETTGAGGTFERSGERLRLTLPYLTRPVTDHSEDGEALALATGDI